MQFVKNGKTKQKRREFKKKSHSFLKPITPSHFFFQCPTTTVYIVTPDFYIQHIYLLYDNRISIKEEENVEKKSRKSEKQKSSSLADY